MVSDDTEHGCFVAQSLIASGGQADLFQKELARRLRYWLLGLPAGIGLATLRAIVKLWVGYPPAHSGVFSAGNGPAMRAPILGASVDDRDLLVELVKRSTRITHTDPKAEQGAIAVALAAQLAAHSAAKKTRQNSQLTARLYLEQLTTLLTSKASDSDTTQMLACVEAMVRSVDRGESTEDFAASMGLEQGVTGYVLHTVPVALHAALSHLDNYREAVTAVITCGGDADTTAAIVGGIVGAGVGREGIPDLWVTHLRDWPRSVQWMTRLATQLAGAEPNVPGRPIALPVAGTLARNLFFMIVVLVHGFRRLLPPY
jgi:ADP-ribosyl-[dinitrogen reductase] hydrolase